MRKFMAFFLVLAFLASLVQFGGNYFLNRYPNFSSPAEFVRSKKELQMATLVYDFPIIRSKSELFDQAYALSLALLYPREKDDVRWGVIQAKNILDLAISRIGEEIEKEKLYFLSLRKMMLYSRAPFLITLEDKTKNQVIAQFDALEKLQKISKVDVLNAAYLQVEKGLFFGIVMKNEKLMMASFDRAFGILDEHGIHSETARLKFSFYKGIALCETGDASGGILARQSLDRLKNVSTNFHAALFANWDYAFGGLLLSNAKRDGYVCASYAEHISNMISE